MTDQPPLLDTLMTMNTVSVQRAGLDDRSLMLIRLAALVAVGASAGSYLVNAIAAEEAGLTLEDARAVLIAVAPIVGSPRVVSAAGAMTEALGLQVGLEEAIEALRS
jgi:alkylhydroperoxidase/carboxymuconolactone decarboxylase family protein YurZ